VIPHLDTIKQGATLSLPVRLNPVVADQPVTDMTGWQPRAELRREDGTLVATLTSGWLDVAARIVLLSAPAADTLTWPLARMVLDIKLTAPGGEPVLYSAISTSRF
jgi:hypothetical protein